MILYNSYNCHFYVRIQLSEKLKFVKVVYCTFLVEFPILRGLVYRDGTGVPGPLPPPKKKKNPAPVHTSRTRPREYKFKFKAYIILYCWADIKVSVRIIIYVYCIIQTAEVWVTSTDVSCR